MLESISDHELLARLGALRRRERETTTEILRHLNEVERRKLHLKLGHSSLFDYCTRHLKYSESAAGRRVQAARCLRQFPRVAILLERGEVNLMTLGLVANILTPQSADELLERIRGKTQREVEAIASTFRPAVRLRDRVQHVTVPAPPHPAPAAPAPTPVEVVPPEKDFTNSQTGSEKTPTINKTVSKLYIQFLADDAFMTKYHEACALLSNRLAHVSFESVLGAVLDEFIARHSPAKREERRESRKTLATRKASVREHDPRAIPQKTRDAVFVRDKGRCTYVGKTGQRCGETRNLHVDHITPVARNGAGEITNLRLLCARHNQLEAARVLGEGFMKPQGRHAPTS
jgi:5-methylcytosine-specific restriction endonuclease McrA